MTFQLLGSFYRNLNVKLLIPIALAVITIAAFLWKIDLLHCSVTTKELDAIASNVLMTPEDRKIIRSYLRPSQKMLEYGSGYSTLYFARFVHSYYSIEHNRQWYDIVQHMIRILPQVKAKIKKYVLFAVEPGYKGWPGGYEEGNREQFSGYIRAVHQLGVRNFDVVLIDGRARVDCAREIIPFLHKDSLVFVHDYVGRPYYSNLSVMYHRITFPKEKDSSLALFKRKI